MSRSHLQLKFKQAFAQGDLRLCAVVAQQCCQESIWDKDIVGFYANYLFLSGQSEAALLCLNQAKEAGLRDTCLKLMYAAIAVELRRIDIAFDTLSGLAGLDGGQIEQLQLITGHLLELQGKPIDAIALFTAALLSAQLNGNWLDDDSTDPIFRPLVRNAVTKTKRGRRDYLYAVVANSGVAASEAKRVQRAIDLYLGDFKPNKQELRRPSFFFMEDLPARPVFPRSSFPCLEDFRQATDQIADEFINNIYRAENRLRPVHEVEQPEQLSKLIAGNHGAKSWSAYYFYRHGERNENSIAECPLTSQLIEGSPIVRIKGHSPEICFSVLLPGAKILPHVGVTNIRSVMHVPLIIPDDCALEITGHGPVTWEKYEPFVFDDTYVHQAWNNSSDVRVVLLADLWNPFLTSAERELITLFVERVSSLREIAESYVSTLR